MATAVVRKSDDFLCHVRSLIMVPEIKPFLHLDVQSFSRFCQQFIQVGLQRYHLFSYSKVETGRTCLIRSKGQKPPQSGSTATLIDPISPAANGSQIPWRPPLAHRPSLMRNSSPHVRSIGISRVP